jgi:serine/threonine protein kinase
MKRSSCPDPDVLAAYVLGRLPPTTLGGIAEHAAGCPDCQQKLQRIDDVSDALIFHLRRPMLNNLTEIDPALMKFLATTETLVDANQSPVKLEPAEWREVLAAPQKSDEIGRVNNYRVLEVLGIGGMGIVFRAEDPRLKRMVALKVMRPAFVQNATARIRFLREARATAKLSHDNIVTIHEVGEEKGIPFFAMQLLQGEPLDSYVERQPNQRLPLAELLRIAKEIADGLAAAHEHKLIHRDIKPSNIWLEGERRRVKILDFGLARGVDEDIRLTQTGKALGTPTYMAPEQVETRPVDHRCDLFSLGTLLYRLSTGIEPFKRETIFETLRAVVQDQVKPIPASLRIPDDFVALINKLMEKNPARRPASAAEVSKTIQAIRKRLARPVTAPKNATEATLPVAELVEEPLAPLADVVEEPAQPGKSSKKLWFAIVGGICCGLIGAGIYLATRPGANATGPEGTSDERNPKDRNDAPTKKTDPAQVDERFLASVSQDPPRQQVGAIREKLRQLNPDFDGVVRHAVDETTGNLKYLSFSTDRVTIIWPVRAATNLNHLQCMGSAPGKGQLRDLSPVKGMNIRLLDCRNNNVEDLRPLLELPHLQFVKCDVDVAVRDAVILKSILTLTRINEKPAAEFWREVSSISQPK